VLCVAVAGVGDTMPAKRMDAMPIENGGENTIRRFAPKSETKRFEGQSRERIEMISVELSGRRNYRYEVWLSDDNIRCRTVGT